MFFLAIVLASVRVGCIDFFINRTIVCKTLAPNGHCTYWESNGSISRPAPKCFPAHTLVLTQRGPKAMSSLQLGDHILGYNEERQRNEYTEVTAWLHRITNKKFEYLKVITETTSFHSSSKHNIAVREDSRAISYVFGRDLLNRTLVSANSNEDIRVLELQDDVALGVYSPYTRLGNYYVLGENIARPLRRQQNILLLVHSFAQISNPRSYDFIFGTAMHLSGILGFSEQPSEDNYVHPLSRYFTRMFPRLVDSDNNGLVHQDGVLLDLLFSYKLQEQKRRLRQKARVMTMLNMIMEGPISLFK